VGAPKKEENEPHAKELASEEAYVRICGAKTRKSTFCMNSSMENGRCRMHGGKSTGPKTCMGKAISSQNASKHKRFAKSLRDQEIEIRIFIKKQTAVLENL